VRFVGGEHLALDSWVPQTGNSPADEEEDYSPGEEVRSDEEDEGGEENEEKEGGGKWFVAEVCRWGEDCDDFVVEAREVFHAVLKIPHIAEEVAGELLDGFDSGCWRERRSCGGVLEGGGRL